MKRRYKHRLERVRLSCRWFQPDWDRSDNWIIFGIAKRLTYSNKACYTVGILGFDLHIWIKRTFIEP